MPDLLDSDDLRLLGDIGFMAVSHGFLAHADAIFTAVEAMRPNSEAASIGLAMIDLAAERADQAVKRLMAAPQTPAVRAFGGLAMLRAGNIAGAREALDAVLRDAPDDPSAGIARAAREQLDEIARHDIGSILAGRPVTP